MLAIGALRLVTADVAFFSLPPERPDRPDRRIGRGGRAVRTLVRALRTELARATDAAAAGRVVPTLTRSYPY